MERKIRQCHLGQNQNQGEQRQFKNQERPLPTFHEGPRIRTKENYFDSVPHVNWTFGSFSGGSRLTVSEAVDHPVTGVGDSPPGEGTLQFVMSTLVKEIAEA